MGAFPAWHESAATLIDVAMGRRHADTLVRNGRWVNVHSGEIIDHTDVAIAAGRFAYVGPDASHTIGPSTTVIDDATWCRVCAMRICISKAAW